ncbi:MAG: chromate transporter [Acidobacteria bacterium RIFCSPLOWO2_02_FULL_67_36]|nr:MAG: chromate transporter [Acidobacteria bacterium RIFCSPLOWO2_02_FULL_67_36]OFW26380.1 MAG: chromate transporter [Acidobacteria bacterium RIFCSPLOWO2_12_FULL_66_21]
MPSAISIPASATASAWPRASSFPRHGACRSSPPAARLARADPIDMRVPLPVVARVFLRLGATAFGGPAGHIAMMHDEIVRRRGWIDAEAFADLIAATNVIPGPNSTEVAVHVGRRVAGWRGLLVAGIAFILPSALIVSAFAALYVRYGRTPDARGLLAGVAPPVVAIIANAVWGLGRSTLRKPALAVVASAAAALALAGVNELLLLAGGALAMILTRTAFRRAAPVIAVVSLGATLKAAAASAAAPVSLVKLTLFFLKVGSVLFGSGYVLIAFLRADLVERWHWLTDRQLLDAIAVGQFTPGPLSTTATFIGYVLGGWPGAVLATIAMFLPAFVFVAVTQPLIPRLRRSRVAGAALDGLVAASLGLMAAVALALARQTLTTPMMAALAAGSLVVLVRWNVNSAWLVLAGAALGILLA